MGAKKTSFDACSGPNALNIIEKIVQRKSLYVFITVLVFWNVKVYGTSTRDRLLDDISADSI